jgi:hypothetical protein
MTVLESIGDYLQTNSQGTLGTNLFLSRMPSSPDVCVTVYEYEGGQPLETMGNSATVVDLPRIQIVCRAGRDDYATARNKAATIRDLLAAVTEQTISGIAVMRIRPTGQVMPLGLDEKDRPTVSINFECFIRR